MKENSGCTDDRGIDGYAVRIIELSVGCRPASPEVSGGLHGPPARFECEIVNLFGSAGMMND